MTRNMRRQSPRKEKSIHIWHADCEKCGEKILNDGDARKFTIEEDFKYHAKEFEICDECYKTHFQFLNQP